MAADTRRMRPNRPWVMTNLRTGDGLADMVRFIERQGIAGGLRPAGRVSV